MADKQPYEGVQQVASDFWCKPVLKAKDGTLFCPGFEGGTYLDNPWDFIAFGTPSDVLDPYADGPTKFSSKTPGKCIIDGGKLRDTDKKKAAGTDGGRTTIHGVPPSEVDIEVLIWTPEQWRQLKSLWAIISPAATKGDPPAYDVYHPLLAMHGIKSLQFISGSGPMVDDKRVGHFKMKAIEFLPPSKKKAVKTHTKSKGSLLDDKNKKSGSSSASQADKYPKSGENKKNTGPVAP